MTTAGGHDLPEASTSRVRPAVAIAAGVFVAYVLIVNGIQFASGVPYAEFFATPHNAWWVVASLAAGSAMLVGFLAWARWDGVWRDPGRLRMTTMMWVAPVVFVLLLLTRLWLKLSGGFPVDLMLGIVAAGIGVGFAEEMLFRGVVLRSLRTGGRSEAWVMLLSSAWFGLMHASNIFVGSPPGIVAFQVVLASLSGATLYMFRRATGLIVVGMVAHGLWDISTFSPSSGAAETATIFEAASLGLAVIVAIIAIVAVFRHDRQIVMGPAGPAPRVG